MDRDRPDLGRLAACTDPVAFVWAILPHAARTFSTCIALLPTRTALAAAVAYLYCRMLDTYEDLVPARAVAEASLRAFPARLDAQAADGALLPASPIDAAAPRDARDRAHLLLVQRADLVDRVFLSLDEATRCIVRDLVRDMAEGMRWSLATFDAQGGVLADDEQLTCYCRHVLGNPVVFTVRLMRLQYGGAPELTVAEREDAMRVGEMIQLANVTRDVEKDLQRGIAYDAALQGDLGRDAGADPALAERCRAARERMLRIALTRASAYGRMVESMPLPQWSAARSSAVLLLLFTERYFLGCVSRVGRAGWKRPSRGIALLASLVAAAVSTACARREIARIEGAFLAASVS
jgi:phytoene/squalene synthetase